MMLFKRLKGVLKRGKINWNVPKNAILTLDEIDKLQNSEDESAKSKNESTISKLKKEKDDHYNEVHYLTEDARKRALGDIKERQKTLDGLKKNLEAFIGKENEVNPAKNLLENLTEGLEKFLGYNKDSKGYSGDGIVYSDLDRLCDGVMSFLHGVLQSVKEDDNVTTYNKHITQNNLDNVLRDVFSKIGTGRNGLSDSVTKVKEWLEKYNDEVEKKTRGVTDGLSALIGKLRSDVSSGVAGNEYYKSVEGEATKDLGTQLARWKGTLGSIDSDVQSIANIQINDLDDTLKAQLTHKLDPVKKVVEHLKGVATSMISSGLVKAVDSAITEKETLVKERIKAKSQELRETLTTNFTTIDERIRAFETAHNGQLVPLVGLVKQLTISVEQANKAALKLDDDYNSEIVGKLQGIDKQVTALDTKDITNGFQTIFATVSEQLGTLHQKLEELGGLGQKVTITVEKNLPYFETGGDPDMNVSAQITKLKEEIRKEITNYVKNGLGDIIRLAIKGKTDLVANSKNHPDGSLDQIVGAVKVYAEKFTQGKFESETLPGWIGAILRSGAVDHRLGAYIGRNNSRFNNKLEHIKSGSDSRLHDVVKQQIIQELKKKMSADFPSYTAKAKEGIEQIVAYVQAACEKFATQLNVKIKNRVGGISSSEIAKEVETNGKDGILTDKRNPTNDSDLTLAVDGILPKLASKARTAAAKLGWLIGSGDTDGKIGNVEAAIRVVNSLGDHLAGEIKKTDSPSQGQTNLGYDIQAKLGTAATNGEVDTKLGELLEKAVKNGINKLDAQVKRIVGDLSSVHPTIEKAIGRVSNTPNGGHPNDIYQAVQNLHQQIERLKPVVIEVNNSAQVNIKHQVTNMKKHVAGMLAAITEINNNIGSINTALKQAIEEAQKSVATAREQLGELITTTETELTQQVNTAFTTVHTAAKTMFNQSHKADLAQLKELINAQKTVIEGIIDEDKKKGLKGLLKEMYGDDGSKLEEFKSYNDPKIPAHFGDLSSKLKDYLELIFTYIKGQLNTPSSSPPNSTTKEPTKMLGEVQSKLGNLLTHLGTAKHFDSLFVLRLESFSTELGKFTPSQFAGPNNSKLLDSLRDGLQKLCDQLDKAYVSAYSGDYWNGNNKNKYANVFCTIMHTFRRDFDELRDGLSGAMYDKSIHLANSNSLGSFFKGCNYNVSKTTGKQGGELKNDVDGKTIYGLLVSDDEKHVYKKPYKGPVIDLHRHIRTYYTACHLTLHDSPKYPCSIRDMLSWLTGLPYTAVYQGIKTHCNTMLKKEITDAEKKSQPADPVISKILQNTLHDNLNHTIKNAYNVLTTICGNGRGSDHADYPYACYFLNNSRGFHYPGSVSSLFDMLKEICSRLLCSLNLLYSVCRTPAKYRGWNDCPYGQDVSGYQWDCHDSSHSGRECLPKSRLQAHLMDGMPGCLPHKLTSVGCKSVCSTCPKSSAGEQCITPMGFVDLPNAASIKGTGNDIFKALSILCKDAGCPLPTLLRCLASVNPYPPRSLGDMLSLYCQVFQKHDGKYIHNAEIKRHLENVTISDSFPLSASLHGDYPVTKLTSALQKLHYSSGDHLITPNAKATNQCHADLWSLSTMSTCQATKSCAPYLHPLGKNAYHTLPKKHAALYLSWCCYLAWEFWDLLQQLLNSFKNIACKSFGCPCKCPPGKHGVTEESSTKPGCHCDSIVDCTGVLSVFYQYGLTFRVPATLYAHNTRRTCDDFVKQLHKVLYDGYFKKLFEEIDEFIWAIRTPFSYLLLALWSLSLLYLLHIAVVRLDVLRIRSHLRSPSSHRIAAQSLLAAARVKALANVKYFSP
ncbi:hypothetical protein, conserved [Babesia ovata]|uniref:C3H1-type domain-containing protein n=1 Tax=Babesia ovata TaxID=189622 RepID=A0A2H6KKF0_9APIC|nr:uncharacterized protein BOVATA_049680 [Babesia ovata]GBE63475.1 hypothetical protein, conserved [Babesia ovata]